jgi:predicted  nucleic acid-binding Zn-ribbon protein
MRLDCDKALPAPPGDGGRRARPNVVKFSEEIYVQLLEEEIQQLRLQNKELREQFETMQGKFGIATEKAAGLKEEIKRRDRLVSEIAVTIIDEFQRYKDNVKHNGEEITVYSYFEFDSQGPEVALQG